MDARTWDALPLGTKRYIAERVSPVASIRSIEVANTTWSDLPLTWRDLLCMVDVAKVEAILSRARFV